MTFSKRIALSILCAGTSYAALISTAAHAQADPEADTAATPESTAGLTEIVVTGEKREIRLQSAPLAITAIVGDELKQRNVNELNDLNGYVPGLTIAKSGGAERIITIRGIGYETAQNPNSQPGVAFHIDGVYIAHVMALNQDLLDVERLEVLRGPQGTVFGETSTGGAINVITKKPVLGEFSGTLAASYGNYDYAKLAATVNIPIGPTLAARASVQYFRHDGYGFATQVPGYSRYPLDNADNIGYRGSLIWKPNDTFTALLEGQGFNTSRNASLQKDVRDTDLRPRAVTQDYPGVFHLNTKMAYLTLSQELSDSVIAKSVTAYQFMNKNQSSDNDRLASPFYFDHIVFWQDKSKTFTQEFSLASQGQSAVDWTVGAFYLRQKASQNILEVITPFAAALVLPDGTGVKFQTNSPFQHTSWAGYGQATFHANEELSFTLGARYSWDKVSAQPYQYYSIIPPRETTSDALTGKLGVEYKITSDNLLYVTASRGYKPTGLSFNSGSIIVPTSYRKEIVDAVEFGSKNEFFDRKLRFNVSAYHYWYKDFQFTAEDPIPFAGGTDNIPSARIYGAEFETSILPFNGLKLDGTLSLGKGKFTSDFLTIDAQTAAQIRSTTFAQLGYPAAYYYDGRIIGAVLAGLENVNGKRVPKLPGIQLQASATYSWSMAGGTVSLRGELLHRGAFNYRLFAVAALDRVPAYTIYNAFLQYEPDDSFWSFSLSAQNLANNNGINSRFSDPYGSGTTSVEYINPRQVFGTLNFNF